MRISDWSSDVCSSDLSPVAISVMDVGGALALSQQAFEDYAEQFPDRAARIVFTKAPVTELAGKLRAQQAANRVDIDIVLTGSDGLAAGLANDTWKNGRAACGGKVWRDV